ncbi:MAG: amidase [Gammaproteobacteria bacterium]|nr:MAG: amidase [Gammaproteobacteria bacterium]
MGFGSGVDWPAARCVLAGTLLSAALYGGALAARDIGSDARELTVARLQAELATHRTSVRSIEAHYAARIAALDARGPTLRSVLEVNPDAAAIAAQLDSAGGPRGPLYGVPVLLKDNIDTADRMLTTAGSLALVDSKPARDAFIVQRLRAAGALILGKTNLSEWANYRSKRSSSGWSGRGGQTKNPYVLDRNPCGSSSGSGTAIAADLALVAVGTETDGSITCPASVNGLVGIKPTVGLISRSGIIPIAASQDTAGPMARTVADAATLLTVLAGYDPDDPATAPLRERPPPDYSRFLDAAGLKGARIGVMRHFAGFHEEVDALFERALAALRSGGAVLVDPADIANAVQDLIAFDDREAGREMPFFRQELFLDAQASAGLTDSKYLEAHLRSHRLAAREGIDAALAKDHLDALVAPTVGPAWTTDPLNGDHVVGGGVTTPPAVAGYPHITVPMGAVHGLPVGLSFVGAAWNEGRLVSYAYAYEQTTHARQPPQFRPTEP